MQPTRHASVVIAWGLALIANSARADFDPQTTTYCNGFWVSGAMVSLRNIDGEWVVSGPLKAGAGLGYEWAICDTIQKAKYGVTFSLFSESFDTQGNYQIGLTAGPQIDVDGKFSIGISIGYDLFRSRHLPDGSAFTNGLFTGTNLGRPSLFYLIGFGLKLGQ